MNVIENNIGLNTLCWLPTNDASMDHEEIYKSWCKTNFLFIEESFVSEKKGLRPPQIGGIYAALGYEKSDDLSAATVVMPTGTGKTETILSIVIAGRFQRTLIIVPSDSLREQTKDKFIKLGLLRELSLIPHQCSNPVVAVIKQGVSKETNIDALLKSNIIIATPSALSQFSEECLDKLTSACSHLIADEAHHITAPTWAKIKSSFEQKPIFQFTATPFRNDGSRIEGRIIFNYPLKKAQDDGYFKKIQFHPITEFVDDLADTAIAEKAIELLRADLEAGLDHIMMARARTITRAKKIFKIYSQEKDLNPILMHSKISNTKASLKAIKNREHKIIVCVDMLGEGFDLPQLKVAAFHDHHKSINIMLQFTGRFTRTTSNVGEAKFVANIADPKVNDSLEELYNEDSNWNDIISNISSSKIKHEKSYQRFKEQFTTKSRLLELGLTPNISTTIYRMGMADWKPDKFESFINKQSQLVDFLLNDEKTILAFSIKSFTPVAWTNSKELFDESWDLYIAYYDRTTNLLYLHSSAKDGFVKKLAELIAKGASQIHGENVFRSLSGLKRLKLQNIGLNKSKKGLRYSMHTGTEINDQIPDIEASRATKSNIFGKGYENGELTSIGCSYKGKIWAMDSNSLDAWVKWCQRVGNKILDNSIDTNEVLKTAMQVETLKEYPDIVPLSVDWPITLLRKNNETIKIHCNGQEYSFIECELSVSEHDNKSSSSIDIILQAKDDKYIITATITQSGEATFSSNETLVIQFSQKDHNLTELLNEHPPTIFMADTSTIEGGLRYFLPEDDYAYRYNPDNTEAWDWIGVDISVESQRSEKLQHSIQYHTINKIKDGYDLVFDDDGSGEVADIVAIKNINDDTLVIDLFHCKYCLKGKNGIPTPGARVDDVYQVAGQATKSIKWFSKPEALIERLITREKTRLKNGATSRIDKGTFDDLKKFRKIARYSKVKKGVAIVQPAISQAKISNEQLQILGAAETYIDDVSGVKLKVIISE